MDQRGARRGTRPGTVGTRPTALAAGLLVVLAAGLAASAERPPLTGDGAWSTPLLVLLGVGSLGLLVVVLLVLQGVLGQRARPRPGRGDPWGMLAAVALLLLVAAVVQRLGPPDTDDPGGGGGGGLLEGVGPDLVAPPPVTPTAVVAGVVALLLLALLAARALRSSLPCRSAPDVQVPATTAGPPTGADLPDGPPAAVVLAAYDRARALASPALGAPVREAPGRLLARARGGPLHDPLATLTRLHLPVRYGRDAASTADADTARAALAEVERVLAAARAPTSAGTGPGTTAGPGGGPGGGPTAGPKAGPGGAP